MKNIFSYLTIIILTSFLFSSCATIVGGSNYYAHVQVPDHPNAKVIYKGLVYGDGNATIKLPRREANKFFTTIKEEGCPDQVFKFTSRSFRGFTIPGSIGLGLLVPVHVWPLVFAPLIVDFATGAVWKPNKAENGITKVNHKNYNYVLNYTACENKPKPMPSIVDVVYLKNGSIIRGVITEQTPNAQIKLKTNDGNIFVFKREEIEKMTKEPTGFK